MQNIRVIVGLMLAAEAMAFAAQYQLLDINIHVKPTEAFRRERVPAEELEKYGRFGGIEPMPFDKYFLVSSVFYDDFIDQNQCVEMRRNLIKQIPIMIQKDISRLHTGNVCPLLQEYTFPKYLPKTFIEKLEACQKESKPFCHLIYKNKSMGRSLILRYWIHWQQGKQKLPSSVIPDFDNNASLKDSPKDLNSLKDQVIDLFNLCALFVGEVIN